MVHCRAIVLTNKGGHGELAKAKEVNSPGLDGHAQNFSHFHGSDRGCGFDAHRDPSSRIFGRIERNGCIGRLPTAKPLWRRVRAGACRLRRKARRQ